MSEILCPICGKSNPADAELCIYCQARLAPFIPEDQFPAVEPEEFPLPELPEEDISRWLEEHLEDESTERLDRTSPESTGGSTARWLEEMRPGFDPNPTRPARRSPDRVETAGPLAGLRGVLSAEPEAVRSRKSVIFPAQLKITANQRAHADLLKGLVEDEGRLKPLPKRGAISSEFLLRWGILLVLLLVLLWPAFTGTQDAPLPVYQEETAELNRLVNQLPEGARVLVGFDYDPGLSAEVEAAAAAVVDHLMSRGAYLTLVSTSPSGPILAERFIRVAQAEHNYISNIQYVNLGYIPGGPVGLLSFVESPQRTLPYSLDGVAAWAAADHEAVPPLQDVTTIDDFSMILVLVDDADTARAWVEQLHRQLADPLSLTALGMVTSAQVEPVMLPYYVSLPRQIHGLVAGLRGGATYARLTGHTGQPRGYWDAFGAGMFVGAITILVGGLIVALLPWINRPAAGRRDSVEGREVDG